MHHESAGQKGEVKLLPVVCTKRLGVLHQQCLQFQEQFAFVLTADGSDPELPGVSIRSLKKANGHTNHLGEFCKYSCFYGIEGFRTVLILALPLGLFRPEFLPVIIQ